ncbi:DUF7079 family protein [Pseudomonas xanthosomatis]|uniref:DUF7079 family protein n=1 Tax=Pseudomonas xanthosomatis TaxID=2842356 RepID=UPI003F821384
MGGLLTEQEVASIRWALSDAFVDNEVDYAAIVRQIEMFEASEVRRILYSEVAPVCHHNLECTLPSVWSCFGKEALEDEIEEMLRRRGSSAVRRLLNTLHVKWLEYRYRYIWLEMVKFYGRG